VFDLATPTQRATTRQARALRLHSSEQRG